VLDPKIENGICLAISRTECFRLCSLFASQLSVGDSQLDPMQLLIALSGRESSFGANLKPRFEPAWFVGGSLWKNSRELQEFVAKYGRAGASSYGPLQVMAFNAQPAAPEALAASPELAMGAAVGYFNRWVIGHWHCKTLEEICRTWNGGNPKAATTPGYYEEVAKHYAETQVHN
jgi:hypothetical protein